MRLTRRSWARTALHGATFLAARGFSQTAEHGSPPAKGLTRYVGSATVIGSDLKYSPGFAAFANALAMHSDDYDDRQLAVGNERVHGLLTHPTLPAWQPPSQPRKAHACRVAT